MRRSLAGTGTQTRSSSFEVFPCESQLGDVAGPPEVDGTALAHTPEHLAKRSLVASAEHVGADVDVEALLLVARARATDAAVLLDQHDGNACVREKERGG